MKARYAGTCHGCGSSIRAGAEIAKWSGRWGHANCKPSGNSRADAEYYRGIQDAENYRWNKRVFGEDAANAMEIEREFREGWDY